MSEPTDGRERLAAVVRRQVADAECWARAETFLRADRFRARLSELGVEMTREVATALMAAAMELARGSDEWGGDYRDALAEVAALGLELWDA